MSARQPEPWLRGPLVDVPPAARPLVYSMMQVREDLEFWTRELTAAELWARPMGVAPVGFHLRHIARSVDRLTTYVESLQLSDAQLAGLKSEMEPGASAEELLDELERMITRCESVVKALDPRSWYDRRTVGRKSLPTTVGGLVTHIAEHSQRHVGEAIVTAKLVKALRGT